MKKIISLLLVFAILFSLTAFAEENEKMKEVLLSVKERIPDTESFENFESSERTRNGITTYTFMWYTSGEDYKEMNVRVTESGIITSYNFYKNNKQNNTPSVNKPETKDFLAKAKELSAMINPSISDKIEVSVNDGYESLYDREYFFRLTHKENGIPVYGNNGSLTISGDGETLTNYYITYSEGHNYGSPEKAIDREKAEKAYAEEIGMNLAYRTEYEERTKKAYLSYVPEKNYGTYIDAFTGKAVEPEEEAAELFEDTVQEESTADKSMGASNSAARFSEAELAEFSKLENLISKDEAAEIVKKAGIIKDKNATLKSHSTGRDYYDAEKYYYSLTFEGENYFHANARVDAVTGKILYFYQDTEYSKEKLPEKELSEKLASYLTILCPGETGEKKEYRPIEDENASSESYMRYINEIPYEGDRISISVSEKDGCLSHYSYTKSNMEFPSPDGIITEAEAADKMFDMIDYEMYYYPVVGKEGKPLKTYLLYMMDETAEIDAFTGERKNRYEVLEIPEYTDIEGHFAESAIKVLKRFGIGFTEQEFRPDDVITQKDYISLLTYAIKRKSSIIIAKKYDASGAYSSAYNYEILTKEERNDEAEVKRLDAAIYFIKALELSDIAELPGIYNCPFTDVAEKEGYVSILSGLGVINGDGTGLFTPERGVTRGEAAVMIYNYLSR